MSGGIRTGTAVVERLPFQASEVYAIWQALKPREAEGARERQPSGLRHVGDGLVVENFHIGKTGKTRDRIGAFAGLSGRTVEKIMQIEEAAAAEPKKYGDLPEM